MPIYSIQLTRYHRDGRHHGRHHNIDESLSPSWEQVERAIHEMDPFGAPLLWILSEEDNPETSCMAVTGGRGVYHVQVADADGNWQEARNPEGDSSRIEVWTSDQGFTTTRAFTWDLAATLQLVRTYFETQRAAPEVEWC